MLRVKRGISGWLFIAAALAAAGTSQPLCSPRAQAASSKRGIISPTITLTSTLTPNRTITGATLTFTPVLTETLPTPPTETPTPTVTPTFTATPTPRPVYLPLLFRLRRSLYLLNGGFESGAFLPGWQESGRLAREVVGVGGGQQHSGKYAALLGSPYYNNHGGCPVGEAAIHQLLDVPVSGHPTLRFWYRICSYDLKDFDYFVAYVSVWPSGLRTQVWVDGRDSWDESLWCCPAWREGIVPLDMCLGRTISITLANAMTNADGWYNTWTVVDDVRLEERP